MCRHSKFIFSCKFLILIFIISNADLVYANERILLGYENVEYKLPPMQLEKFFYNNTFVNGYKVDKNTTCGRDLDAFQKALMKPELWALKMFDAASKVPSGIFEGNIIDLGMYDECLAVQGKYGDNEIRGRHCMYTIKLSQKNTIPINLTLSVCMPDSCSNDEVKNSLTDTFKMLNRLPLPIKLKITVESVICSIDSEIWDTKFIVCLFFLLLFISVLVICSLCEIVCKLCSTGDNKFLNTLSQFSFQRNVRAIFSIQKRKDNFPIIHGIRFLSIAWIVLGHQYGMFAYAVNVNNIRILEWIKSWNSLHVFVAMFSVDTFFTVSGFLMTYIFLKQMPKQKKFNVLMYYLHRYLRLTPSVIALIVLTIVFLPKMNSGPRWNSMANTFTEQCSVEWWHLLLYVQNFTLYNYTCLPHLWYLAVDMQLFWISPIIIYPLYKKPKFGLIIFVLLLVTSIAVPAAIVGINKYPAMLSIRNANPALGDFFKNLYIKPYNRATPWLLGILLGFEVANYNRRHSKIFMCTGWLLTIAAFTFCTLGTRSFSDPNYEYNIVWEIIFASMSKLIWSFGVCWIIYASTYNCAGPISSILSWEIFQPLSRLSYCIYLLHPTVLMLHTGAQRTPNYLSDYNTWHAFISNLVMTIIAAFCFSLLFESPILVLEKMLIRRKIEHQNKQLSDSESSSDKDVDIKIESKNP